MGRREKKERSPAPWRSRLYQIIFESDTRAGRAFDLSLIVVIVLSILIVMLESVAAVKARWGGELLMIEWALTIVFTIEYLLRLLSARSATRYATSFFGVVDLLAVLPTYASLFIPGAHSLLVIRTFRLMRIFRILKLAQYLSEANLLFNALHASRRKITVFLLGVSSTVITVGALMYLIEGEANGFTSIPKGVYWAIVCMTTVGFGDITPKTPLGQTLASALMIIGYGVIAVPTGIVTSELIRGGGPASTPQGFGAETLAPRSCPSCDASPHDLDARHCKFCGGKL